MLEREVLMLGNRGRPEPWTTAAVGMAAGVAAGVAVGVAADVAAGVAAGVTAGVAVGVAAEGWTVGFLPLAVSSRTVQLASTCSLRSTEQSFDSCIFMIERSRQER